MSIAIEKRPFVADAVFVPEAAVWTDSQGEHADPAQCVKLMVDGDNNSADVFTEEAWSHDRGPFCRREWGQFTPLEGGRVELLPELWVVKIDEREHWLDPEVLAACPRLYGLYVFDRKQHFHICSFEATYELHFLGSDYTEADKVRDDDYRREDINSRILEGDCQSEQVTYWSAHDIDRMLETEIMEGCLPPEGKNGGYRLRGIVAVTYEDAVEEAREAHHASSL